MDEGEPVSIWPYTTRRWERVRQQKMMRDPLCEACLTVGEIVPAEVVDHRRPITKEGRAKRSAAEAFPPLDALASLCARRSFAISICLGDIVTPVTCAPSFW